jgi:hypothetical protein
MPCIRNLSMDAAIVPPDITSVLETTKTKFILSSCVGMPSSILCRLANDATPRYERHVLSLEPIYTKTLETAATRSPELLNAGVDFIKYKGAREGEVYTKIIIRTLTGHELRDKKKGAVDIEHLVSGDV